VKSRVLLNVMSNIVVIVSVDWEGRSLLDGNLEAMKNFRGRHQDVPMQQFLNAAYYTKQGADLSATTKKIQSTLLPEDDHGIHLHAWNSLFEKAGITVVDEPGFIAVTKADKFYRNADDWDYYKNDWGYGVRIDQYNVEELTRVIQTSIDILMAEGFHRPYSFRAGGYMAGQNVFEALSKNRFKLDASAGNIRFVKKRFGDVPFVRWVSELWSHIDDCSQPYKMSTTHGDIWQLPNNGCLADYTTAEDILEVFDKNVRTWQQLQEQPVFISIGFHQETAGKFLDRVDSAITAIKEISLKQNLPVVFSANPLAYLERT